MQLYDYIDEAGLKQAIADGYVNANTHPSGQLGILSYSRKTTYDNHWDAVTRKTRGLIYRMDTGEIVARPFEKFFNANTEGMPDTSTEELEKLGPPTVVLEKLDGFMLTMYTLNGVQYFASKGSFNSVHSRWANAWLRKRIGMGGPAPNFPEGYTPVFEGITPALRIVVNYEERDEPVLLALIHNETGIELNRQSLKAFADMNGFSLPVKYDLSITRAIVEVSYGRKDFEGFVLQWERLDEPPYRVKVKFEEYLRLHRLVTRVSPKAILEIMATRGEEGVKDLIKDVPSWFKNFVERWAQTLTRKFKEIDHRAFSAFMKTGVGFHMQRMKFDWTPTRKDWALKFTSEENKDISRVLFTLLDRKDPTGIIWGLVRPITAGAQPMVDETA